MSITIDVTSDIKFHRARLSRQFKRQIPYAANLALNDTAFGLQRRINSSTHQQIDRPNRFTQKAAVVSKSTKVTLRAAISVKNKQWDYLKYIVDGSKEKNVDDPKIAKTNVYGNLSKGYIRRNLAKPRFFYGRLKGRPAWTAGLYRRTNKNTSLELHVAFEPVINHSKVWRYRSVVNLYVRRNFNKNMRKSIAKALATAR